MHFFFVSFCVQNQTVFALVPLQYEKQLIRLQTISVNRFAAVYAFQRFKNNSKMNLTELSQTGASISVTISLSDLTTFAEGLISNTKKQLEADVIAATEERFLSRTETCEFLQVDQSTLWRWANRGFLVPVEMGGKRLYKLSDLKRILNNGRA